MTDQSDASESQAATEAAQNVVDTVTSWDYSADKDKIESKLEDGLDKAGVDVDDSEKERLVDEIDSIKNDEDKGAPEVGDAAPQE